MVRGLNIFQSDFLSKKRKTIKPTTYKKVVTFSECVFLSPQVSSNRSGPINIEFQIGDQAIFLGRIVTIKKIMLDENQNVIYRIRYSDSVETSVQQELLERNRNWSIDSVSSKIVPMENTTDKNEAIHFESFPALLSLVVDPKEATFENGLTKKTTQGNEDFFQEREEIKVSEIFKFLELKESSNELERMENVLKIYKFLVQNSQYDDSIVDAINPKFKENSIDSDDLYIRTRITSLAFQHLLFTLEIGSRVVVSQNRTDGTFHNVLLVQLSKKCFFFDVENERRIYAMDNTFPYLMAGLGVEEYCKDYEVFGILPQNGSDKLLPLPSNVSAKRFSIIILNGYDREINDLTYLKNKKSRKEF